MGGQAWLDGRPLYADGAIFETQGGLELPFTYPPLAAVLFSPFALLSLDGASLAITLTPLILLVVSTVILLTRLDVWPTTEVTGEPAWVRRCWLAAAVVAPAVIFLEPIRSNFEFGQINVVLMTLVIADCVPRRTPWPRGLLLGVAIGVAVAYLAGRLVASLLHGIAPTDPVSFGAVAVVERGKLRTRMEPQDVAAGGR